MTRSDANAHRKQRPTPLQLHQQHHRRSTDLLRTPLPPAPLRRPDQRGANIDRPSHALARRSPELNGSSERRRDDGRSREQSKLHDPANGRSQRLFVERGIEEHPRRNGFFHQPLTLLPPPSAHQLTGYERERRREEERRLSVGPRELNSLRENAPMQPAGPIAPSTREENRAVELTRLNAVVVQRNNTIAETQRQNEQLKNEISRLKMAAVPRLENASPYHLRRALQQKTEEFEKMREALGSRTRMTVALHDICNRQHGFLQAVGTSIYAADAAQRQQFDAWVKSNELYMGHVKSQVAFETNWEDMARRATAEAVEEIRKAARQATQQVAPHVAEQTDLPAAQQSRPQHDVQHAVEQLIQEATEELDTQPNRSAPAG